MEAEEHEKMSILLRKNLKKDDIRTAGLPPEFPDFDLIIAPAWREIRFCFEHWLDWGVTLLCSALLEYAIKDRAWDLDNPDKKWDGKGRNKYFKDNNVEACIEKCFRNGLINSDQKDKLWDMCIKSRDPLSHMNVMNVSKDKIYPSMPMLSVDTGIIVMRENVEALDNPFASKAAFWQKVNNLSVEYISDTYELLNLLYKDAIKKYSEVLERRKKGDYSDGGAVFGTW